MIILDVDGQITNKHLKNTLILYGCTPRKSLTLKFPNIIDFKNDFIRGYIDGDGCIYVSKKKASLDKVFILGTEDFLNTINNHFSKNNKLINHGNFYELTYSGNTARNLLKLLYENSTIHLERKFLKYQKMIAVSERNF